MRKCSLKFQSKRCGGRKATAVSPVTGKKQQYDACKVTHETVHSKIVQLASMPGLRNLLGKFPSFWVPRNERTNTAGQPSHRDCEEYQATGKVDYKGAERVMRMYSTTINQGAA